MKSRLVHFAIPKLAKITATSEEFATMAPVYAKAMNFMEMHASNFYIIIEKNFARYGEIQLIKFLNYILIKDDCNANGICNDDGVCNCKIGFTGTYCD